MLESARRYLSGGFSVLPLRPKDKKPAIATWKEYQDRKPAEADLEIWFADGTQNNLGIVTGKVSGIVVVDLDSQEAIEFAERNNFPDTPSVATGKGFHAYYRYKEGVRNFQKRDDLPGIDLRGDGGYVVAPPSIHPSGKQYQWVKGKGLNDLPLADLPESILAKSPENKTQLRELYKGVPERSRNDSLTRLVGSWVNDGLSYDECLEMAHIWNSRNPLPIDGKELKRTVKSIFDRHQHDKSNTLWKQTENAIIGHPSYEINNDFLALGFNDTRVKNRKPDDVKINLIGIDNTYQLCEASQCPKIADKPLIFSERASKRPDIESRWSKERMLDFIKNPQGVSGLYGHIKNVLQQHIEFQKHALYGLVSAWIIATYFHRIFNAFPFIFLYGKKQSGKSRLLDILERLCFNAQKTKITTTPTLSYILDALRGTFLLDQAESLGSLKNREFLGYLADSYTVGGGRRTSLQPSKEGWKAIEFETYSPKAFASIKDLDSDLKDRCVQIIMVRASKEYPYPEAHFSIWKETRDKLYRLLLTQWKRVREIYSRAGEGVSQRIRELWRPIETILKLENVSDEEMGAIKEVFLESMIETQSELDESEEELIRVILDLLKDNSERAVSVSEIAQRMTKPMPDMSDRGFRTWLGNRINQLSLSAKNLGRKRHTSTYLFVRQQVEEMRARYSKNGSTGGEVVKTSNSNALGDTTSHKDGGHKVVRIRRTTSVLPSKTRDAHHKPLKIKRSDYLPTCPTTSGKRSIKFTPRKKSIR